MTLKRLAETGRVHLRADLGGSVFIHIAANTQRRCESVVAAIVRAGGTYQNRDSRGVVAEIAKGKARKLGIAR